MTRVHYDRSAWDYERHIRDHRWDSAWLELPRLWTSAVALAAFDPKTVLDPACGDGAVVLTAHRINPIEVAHFGDISGASLKAIMPESFPFEANVFQRDAFDTLAEFSATPVDTIVLTEIVEHVEEPDRLLALARKAGRTLVASSPIVRADKPDHTMQHVWSFDEDGYRQMLVAAGWEPVTWFTANCKDHPYEHGFQVWGCV